MSTKTFVATLAFPAFAFIMAAERVAEFARETSNPDRRHVFGSRESRQLQRALSDA